MILAQLDTVCRVLRLLALFSAAAHANLGAVEALADNVICDFSQRFSNWLGWRQTPYYLEEVFSGRVTVVVTVTVVNST